MNRKPKLYTILSPELIHLYDMAGAIVVVIDVLRATSTIAALLYMGAMKVIPVNSVEQCLSLGVSSQCITAGERNGKIVPGLMKGNSPSQFSQEEVMGKVVALTTTNGTTLLNELLLHNAKHIITGSFVNIKNICEYLCVSNKDIVLACAGWKGMINIEDALFAGAVVDEIKQYTDANCDASTMADQLYLQATKANSLADFMKNEKVSHYQRLVQYTHESDIELCFSRDKFPTLPLYRDGALYAH